MTARTVENVASAESSVRSGKVDAALVPSDRGYEVVGDDEIDDVTSQALSATVATAVLDQNARALDVDLDRLQAGTAVDERLLDPGSKDSGMRKIAAFVFVLVFYVTALGSGMMIAQSVTQEKESRVVEILAAAVPIRALLWGKIAGNTVLAIGQVVLLVATGAVALLLTGRGDDLRVVGPAMGWYVVFFVLGFVALASLWSVAGSLASRQQDLQATTMPGQVLLFAPYILAVTAGEGVKTVVSMLPVVSTMMMPARMAEGPVPGWQVAVAILTTLVAALLMVRVGAAAYERTLLRTGNRIGYREALTRVSVRAEPEHRDDGMVDGLEVGRRRVRIPGEQLAEVRGDRVGGLGHGDPTAELDAQGRDARVGDAARHEPVVPGHVDVGVQREPVHRDPARDPDADRRDLALEPRVIGSARLPTSVGGKPDAGATRHPS